MPTNQTPANTEPYRRPTPIAPGRSTAIQRLFGGPASSFRPYNTGPVPGSDVLGAYARHQERERQYRPPAPPSPSSPIPDAPGLRGTDAMLHRQRQRSGYDPRTNMVRGGPAPASPSYGNDYQLRSQPAPQPLTPGVLQRLQQAPLESLYSAPAQNWALQEALWTAQQQPRERPPAVDYHPGYGPAAQPQVSVSPYYTGPLQNGQAWNPPTVNIPQGANFVPYSQLPPSLGGTQIGGGMGGLQQQLAQLMALQQQMAALQNYGGGNYY